MVRDWTTRHIKSFCFCELFSGTFSAEGTVSDCIHDDVGGNLVCRLTVSDHKGSITELADYACGFIRSIQERFDSGIIKNQIATAGLFDLPFDVDTSFFFGITIDVVVHDDTLPEWFMYGKQQCCGRSTRKITAQSRESISKLNRIFKSFSTAFLI